MATFKAIELARDKDLDLVEINSTSRPPVCRIMDFGKFKYDQAKQEKQRRSKQKETEIKEIRLTPKIGEHDVEYKAKQAREFFMHGSKVKVSMRLRGRENVFVDNAYRVFERFSLQSGLEFERQPLKSGNQIVGMLVKIKEEAGK